MRGGGFGTPPSVRWVFLVVVTLVYFGVLNARPDFTRFNSHDSESYLALAQGLADGRGYTRSFDTEPYVPHKTWPPGLPILLVPAVALSGPTINWALAKGSVIAVGLVGGLFGWLLTARVTGSRLAADLAAALLLLNGFYWDFSHQVMAEVPATAWALFALWLCDRAMAGRDPTLAASGLTGLVCGLGMLIKGHLLGLGFIVFAHATGPRGMTGSAWRKAIIAAIFCVMFVVPFGAWSVRNASFEAPGWDGVSQVRQVFTRDGPSSSSFRSPLESVSAMVASLTTHAIYRVPEQMLPFIGLGSGLAWPGSGWVALTLSVALAALAVPLSLRRQYLGIFAVVVPLVMLNLLFATGGSARYWVPCSSLLLVAIIIRNAEQLTMWAGRTPLRARILTGGTLVLLAAALVAYVVQHERNPYNPRGPWIELAELFDDVRQHSSVPAAVLTPNSHAFQLITGKSAPMVGYSATQTFDFMIGRTDGERPIVPAGTVTILEVRPWRYVRLPTAMSAEELLGPGDHAYGIPVEDWPEP